jgi:hypothetical protein
VNHGNNEICLTSLSNTLLPTEKRVESCDCLDESLEVPPCLLFCNVKQKQLVSIVAPNNEIQIKSTET